MSQDKSASTPKREFGRVPNRYWIETENGWYSVERGSPAHLEAAAERNSGLPVGPVRERA